MTVRSLLKRPSAFVPLLMSCVALLTLAIALVSHGLQRQPDEGVAAHVWQFMMAGQLPVIAFFALRWVRRAPRAGLVVLSMQLLLMLLSLAPVFLLRL